MKIAFFYNSFFRHGGIQRVVANIVNELSKYHKVELICNEEIDIGNNPYNIKLDQIKATHLTVMESTKIKNIRLAIITRVNKFLKKIKLEQLQKYTSNDYYRKKSKNKLINYINNQNYDVVIGCSISFNMILASIKEQINCKIIGWENNSFESYFVNEKSYSNQRVMCKTLLSKLDEFIVLTENDHRLYKESLGLDSIIISNPLSFTSEIKSKYTNKTILSVGRLDHDKGFDLLLDIFHNFSKNNLNWNLKIIGEGAMYNQLEKSIKNKNLSDKVSILPYTMKINEEYLKADIYVNTSRYESFGLTVLEAMECGLPILTFNTVGPSELVIKNKCGVVIKNYEIDKYADSLDKLANNAKMIKKLGVNAINGAENHKIYKIIKLWNDVLSK